MSNYGRNQACFNPPGKKAISDFQRAGKTGCAIVLADVGQYIVSLIISSAAFRNLVSHFLTQGMGRAKRYLRRSASIYIMLVTSLSHC